VCGRRVGRDEPRVKPLGLAVFGVVDVWPAVSSLMLCEVSMDCLDMVGVFAALRDMKVLLWQECDAREAHGRKGCDNPVDGARNPHDRIIRGSRHPVNQDALLTPEAGLSRRASKRAQEPQKRGTILGTESLICRSNPFSLPAVAEYGFLGGGGGAIVEQGPAKPQTPQCRRSKLVRLRGALRDPVTGADVVQKQIGKERYRPAVKRRADVWTSGKRRHVA
jgi:hypothetical protein